MERVVVRVEPATDLVAAADHYRWAYGVSANTARVMVGVERCRAEIAAALAEWQADCEMREEKR